MGYYDVDPPDPGRLRTSQRNTLSLTCSRCTFRTNDKSVASLAAAREHIANHPTHVICYRGVPQEWASKPIGGAR